MIEAGTAEALGASCDGEGVNFALYAGRAEAVFLCLFDADGSEAARLELPARTAEGVWHGYVPGCRPGQHYGYRVHGVYAPERGLRHNVNKLLIDPYARELAGEFRWRPEVLGFDAEAAGGTAAREAGAPLPPSTADSAACVPKAVVQSPRRRGARRGGGTTSEPGATRPRVPWTETVIYETHVRGYTMRHPAVPEADRGTFRGLRGREVLDYLRALGVTSIELMPVHAYIDEHFLYRHGLRNFWGYNSIAFFAPEPRYLGGGPVSEFRDLVDALHEAGLEVILDVVYNHTGEEDARGPTLGFRGLDNAAYYRLRDDDPSEYVNHTGCGNTINTDHPQVQRLILDSLRYWSREMGVDGFRFDLAPVLGRGPDGFGAAHPLLAAITEDPALAGVKLIAEPWDLGPGGYRLGGFPPGWAEWNDRFRDSARRFWRGDEGEAPELARRLHGSADLFEPAGRPPAASINFVASHDGFTTADVVSYARRHNRANREHGRDGQRHDFSCNHGVEGPSEDPEINAVRRRQRLNLLASVLLSQGTPMLLAGDELGNSQGGNNNAYAQDNPTGWIDWSGLESDPEFQAQIRALLRLRREIPLLRQPRYRHGETATPSGRGDIEWLAPVGERLSAAGWHGARALGLLLCDTRAQRSSCAAAAAVLLNAGETPVRFELPDPGYPGAWRCRFSSAAVESAAPARGEPLSTALAGVPGRSCACYAFGAS